MKSLARHWYQLGKVMRTHQTFVMLVVVLLVLLAVFIRINELGSMPLDQAYLQQEGEKIKSVKFNEEAIEQIKALNESNVNDPGTRLPTDRQNPFSE